MEDGFGPVSGGVSWLLYWLTPVDRADLACTFSFLLGLRGQICAQT